MGKKLTKAPAEPIEQASTKGSINDLIGNAISVQEADGKTLIIPSDKSGNRVANMILAAQIRTLIQTSITTYKEKDMLPTPKDLKDLAEAAKSLHQFSGEVYKEDDGTPLEQKTKAQKVIKVDAADDVDFSKTIEPPAS